MIITRTEVKTLLDNSNLNDSLIDSLIPIIEQVICDYCNQDFFQDNFDYVSSNDISFINTDNSINMTNLNDYKFVANDSIRVYGSLRNDGPFTISSVTTDKIIINSINTIVDEDENESIFITKVKYPVSFKFIAAQMIKYNIDNKKIKAGVLEEDIDDYRYKLSVAANGYPTNLVSGLKTHRTLYKKSFFDNVNICVD
jgi:hypothetical protein